MDSLKDIVGADRVSFSRLERLMHSHDLAPVPRIVAANYDTMPAAVVKPKSTDEVEQLVKEAMKLKTQLVPKGMGTSYLWGSVPVVGGVTVDMSGLNEIHSFSAEEGWTEAGAGATWGKVEKYLSRHGHTLRVYPTSMPSATLGGWVASSGSGLGNGGYGVGSVKYGPVGANVAGLEVVTGEGVILNLSKPEDIADFVGSDGITGLITKVRIKTREKPESTRRTLVTAPNGKALQSLVTLLKNMQSVYYAQFEDSHMLNCKSSIGLHAPSCEDGFLLFSEFEGEAVIVNSEMDQLARAADELGGKTLSENEADKEWDDRFYPMRVKRGGPTVIAGEFIVNSSSLASALKDVYSEFPKGPKKRGVHGIVAKPPHVILMPQVFSDERRGFKFLAALSYAKRFNDIGPRYGGKPYGVGHLNAFNSKVVHGADGFSRLKYLKGKFDPGNIINPGKGIKHGTRYGFAAPAFLFNLSMFGLGLFRKLGV